MPPLQNLSHPLAPWDVGDHQFLRLFELLGGQLRHVLPRFDARLVLVCVFLRRGGLSVRGRIHTYFCILLYPDVYPNVFLGYIRIHQDTSGYNVLNVSWPEYRGSHRIRAEYIRIRAGYSILEDTSGYTQDTSGYVRIQI